MAVDNNGQLFFTFEEKAQRLNKHLVFLQTKTNKNEPLTTNKRFVSRFNRICKLKAYVYKSLSDLISEVWDLV